MARYSNGAYKGLTVEINGNTSNFNAALNQAANKAKGTASELRKVNKALKVDPTNAKLLAQQQEIYQKKIKATTEQLEILRKKEREIMEAGGPETVGSEMWTQLQSDIVRCEQELGTYSRALKNIPLDRVQEVSEKFAKVGDTVRDAGEKVARVGDSMTHKVTAPLAAVGSIAVGAAVEIDTALTGVRKTVDGTEQEYQELKTAAIDFSKTNAVEASTILDLQALGAQLGFAKDELAKFAEVASGLDIATDMSAETAASEMAQFANITKMAHSDIERYASTIVNLGNNMATTESKVSSMGQRVAAAGTQVGMSQSEILGWSGAMASMGIEAEAGGSAFSTMVKKVNLAVSQGGEDLDKYAKMAGMTAEEFGQAWQTSASDTFTALLKGVGAADNMTVALSDLGVTEIRQSDMMARLAGNTDLVSEALKIANDGWNENTALSKEVANRNESLAAKFDILKNRVFAVAEEVGEPLADALMDALDAAEPLFEMIEDGAEAFSNLSKEEQQTIIGAVGAVAAFGPLLSIAGRMGASVGGAMSSLGNLGSALAQKMKGVEEMSAGAEKAVGGLKSGLIGIGIAAAATAAAFAIQKWQEYQQELKDTADASLSLQEIEAGAANTEQDQADWLGNLVKAFTGYNDELDEIAGRCDDLVTEVADANRDLGSQLKDINIDSRAVDRYIDTIERLTSKTDLNAKEQEELRQAVAGYNDATGEHIEVIDAATGKLSENTGALKANADAWRANAREQAYTKRYQQAVEDSIAAEDALSEARQKQADALKAKQDAESAYYQMLETDADMAIGYGQEVLKTTEAYEKATEAVNDAQTALDSSNKMMEDTENTLADMRGELNRVQESTKRTSEVVTNDFSDPMKAAINDIFGDLGNFSYEFAQAGGDIEKLRDIGVEKFNELAIACNGDTKRIAKALADINENCTIDDKIFQITAENNAAPVIEEVKGQIDEFAKTSQAKLGETGASVDEMAQKFVAAGGNASTLKDMGVDAFVNLWKECNGDVEKMKGKLQEWNDAHIDDKHTEVKADDQASGTIDTVRRKLDGIPSVITTRLRAIAWQQDHVGPVPLQAHGGIFKQSGILDSIPKHASGGIVTQAQLSKVGWVGEAGAEAIVPLTNQRYVRPFAAAIASQLGGPPAAPTYNIYLNDWLVNDNAAIRQGALNLLNEIMRRSDMNRG